MSDTEKFLYKGHVIHKGDRVKTKDANSGEVGFYQIERVWGHHAIMRRILEDEAGPNPISVIVQREVKR